jgi:hypothetical protein
MKIRGLFDQSDIDRRAAVDRLGAKKFKVARAADAVGDPVDAVGTLKSELLVDQPIEPVWVGVCRRKIWEDRAL